MTVSRSIPERRFVLLASALCAAEAAARPWSPLPVAEASSSDGEASALGVVEWLQRMHAASKQRSYIGTFVVSAETGDLSSARIWHASKGGVQIERIEALSGPPRSTFRRNDRVVTFLPESKVVKSEKRESFDLFPNLTGAADASISESYGARVVGTGRVAGFDTDVVRLEPRDDLRFGYRVWSERGSGLVMKLQTLDQDNKVIEQSAFSELQLNAPIKVHALIRMMSSTAGYRVEEFELERSSPQREGWMLGKSVTGFKPVHCYRRPTGGEGQGYTMQWTFSDGLASVSLFLEPYDAGHPSQEALFALGATHTLTRRLPGKDGDWWLTAVGEVPPRTLDAFARGVARSR
jgi:sigma-E factor negative regulatory protein RseB